MPAAPRRRPISNLKRRPFDDLDRVSCRLTRCHPRGTARTTEEAGPGRGEHCDDLACAGGARTISQKKSKRDDKADPVERAAFEKKQMKLPVERLVFIDEFAVNTSMTRTHARAPRGERAEVSEPGHHGPNISALSALSLSGVSAMMTIEGAVDTQAFDLYVEHLLVPELIEGDIVLLDNVKFHYSQRAISLIEAAGARVEHLPAYSPD